MKFNATEREMIVSQLFKLGLYELADTFDGIPMVFNSTTGKCRPKTRKDDMHINHIEKLFHSRTYLIIRAHDIRDDIYDPIDFFLGLNDDDWESTEFIDVDPQGGAVVYCPAFYPGYDYSYDIESFMYNKLPNSSAWNVITSIQLPMHEFNDDIDDTDDDLPF